MGPLMKTFLFVLCCFIITMPVFADPNKDLLKAAKDGNLEQVKKLVEAGADVNHKNTYFIKKGWTPLHWASFKGKKKVVAYLLAKGADKKAKANNGTSILYTACTGGLFELCKSMIKIYPNTNQKTGTGWNPLHGASAGGHFKIVQLLIQKGGNVNAQDISGATPLHWVAFYGYGKTHLKIMKLLIKKGANVNTMNNYKKTPLDQTSNDKMKKILLAAGAKSGKDLKK